MAAGLQKQSGKDGTAITLKGQAARLKCDLAARLAVNSI